MSCSTSPMVGSRPTLRASFRDVDGELADPTAITVRVRKPDGNVTTYTHPDASITNVAVGVWDFTLPAAFDQAGKWHIYVVGSGGGGSGAAQYVYSVAAPKMVLA